MKKSHKKKKWKPLRHFQYNPVRCSHVIQFEELIKYIITGKVLKGKYFGIVQLPFK